jgi:hypothetical protein
MLPLTERDGEPAHDRIGDHSGARLRSMICCVRSILSDELDRPSEARIRHFRQISPEPIAIRPFSRRLPINVHVFVGEAVVHRSSPEHPPQPT